MYTLRKIIDGISFNKSIGDSYHVIDKECNYEKFAEAYNLCFDLSHVPSSDAEAEVLKCKCYMILVYKEGQEMIPLYEEQANYIMTESGKTFSNLSLK